MSNKSIIYSYREGDKKRGELLFTNDKTLEKHYPNSFGVSKSAMEIRDVHEQQKLFIKKIKTTKSLPPTDEPKVIIVGNSPNVLKNEYGPLIDSYDIVIRINKCVTKNYEKYVGSKIDIWATTFNSANWYGKAYIPDNYQNISQIWKRTPSTKLDDLPKRLKSLTQVKMYKSRFYNSSKNSKTKKLFNKYELKAEPCTGLLTILTATRFYKDITIYGFSFFDESGGLVRDYYAFDESSISKIELKKYESEENKHTHSEKGRHFFSSDQKEAKLNILKELELNNEIKFLNKSDLLLSFKLKECMEKELAPEEWHTREKKTYNVKDGKSYTEFFAFNKTLCNNLNDVRDSDDCAPIIKQHKKSNPPDGEFLVYWENGNLRHKWYYKDGKQDGVSEGWWPSGDLKSKRNYKNGKKHGSLQTWYENADPYVTGPKPQISGMHYFFDGKRHGKWEDYYKSGQIWARKIYDHGELIYEKYWNEDGSVGDISCHIKGERKQFYKINPKY